ncbi:two component system sensor histidine kinase [Desulfosarcina variabilis str. Montpellier]|uniref:hybrid sensor histidine kinase/response regulator n=1 Tax=Desulfosarcina variabilis TaxID=2300 RepID=UPI003AFAE6F8
MKIDGQANLLKVLGFAVVIREAENCFRLIGDAPSWFGKLCKHGASGCLPDPPEEHFPFLANFMVDAKAFWDTQNKGRLRSGMWIQCMPDGTQIALEASAVQLGREKLLLIESCDVAHTEKQALIQTGRELELNLDQSRRQQRIADHLRAELETRVEERSRDLLASNARLKSEIEERKRAEKSLADSEHRFRTLFDNLFDAQVLVNQQGRIRDVNSAACRLMASPKDALCTHQISDLFPAHEAQSIHNVLVTTLKAGMAPIDEICLYRDDHSAIPVEGGCVRLEINGDAHVVFSFHDVSYRKALQFQLQQAQKMEAIGTLASGIAHDFNNILSAIIGYAEIVRLDLDESTKTCHNLDQVLAAGNRAKDLVQQILTFSRQAETIVKSVKIRPIIVEALKLMRATLPSSIAIDTFLISRSTVRCDPTQIHQICINLCTNAGQSMAEDGGTIAVHLTDVTLDESFVSSHARLKAGDYVRLSVVDSGPGIPDSVIDKIFEPFFTTKPNGRGTGMGLSVVHGIVTAAGGAVTVQNQAGGGCRFDVYLPLFRERVDDSAGDSAGMPKGSERILFVDDETVQADLARQVLTRLGYDVVAKTSSVEALSLFEQDPAAFDLVVTDMTMPALSGKRLAQRIHAIRSDVPMILCSGFSSSISDTAAGEMGFTTYLKKPLVMKDMAVAIRQALDATTA